MMKLDNCKEDYMLLNKGSWTVLPSEQVNINSIAVNILLFFENPIITTLITLFTNSIFDYKLHINSL